MKEEIDSTVAEAVIYLLKGIDVNGETMEYIINNVGMRDQMKAQLSVESQMPDAVIDQIAKDIYVDLDNEGVDIIEEQEYGINANEIVLESISLDFWKVQAIIRDTLRSHFTPME
jgi:hypothetical protein